MTAKDAKQKLKTLASPDVAQSSGRFFKTGTGQYSEGDIFIGIKVPTLRNVSREFRSLPVEEVESLLKRFTASCGASCSCQSSATSRPDRSAS
jgi:hypothetical protein